jgi:hypothetical protein
MDNNERMREFSKTPSSQRRLGPSPLQVLKITKGLDSSQRRYDGGLTLLDESKHKTPALARLLGHKGLASLASASVSLIVGAA